jgi:hypothetical protein
MESKVAPFFRVVKEIMKNWLPVLTCFFLVLSFSACAKSSASLDRVYVKNATGSRITDVKINHQPAQWFGSVNAILPQRSLDIGFPGQPVPARKASVSWRDGDGVEWSLDIDLPYDQTLEKAGRPMSLIYIIYPSGRLDVHLLESLKMN